MYQATRNTGRMAGLGCVSPGHCGVPEEASDAWEHWADFLEEVDFEN